jgi:hypothetical protein
MIVLLETAWHPSLGAALARRLSGFKIGAATMAMDVVPSLEFRPLSGLEPGTFVYVPGRTAFICVGGTDPCIRLLVSFNQDDNRFEYHVPGAGEQALAVRGAYVLEPDLSSICPQALMDRTSGPDLFVDGGVLRLPVLIVNGPIPQLRSLNVQSWAIERAPTSALPFVKKWRLGVRGGDDKPQWLLEIGQR